MGHFGGYVWLFWGCGLGNDPFQICMSKYNEKQNVAVVGISGSMTSLIYYIYPQETSSPIGSHSFLRQTWSFHSITQHATLDGLSQCQWSVAERGHWKYE